MNSIKLTKKVFAGLLLSAVFVAALPERVAAESKHGHEAEHGEEGAIKLSREQLERAGIVLVPASTGKIRNKIPVYGKVISNAEQVQSVTARFAGIVREVHKRVGDAVSKGETLLTVEANESLKTYSITASINGLVTERSINVGEQTSDRTLILIQDLSSVWVELSVFPKDFSLVTIGQAVNILSLDKRQHAKGTVFYIAPAGLNESQAINVRVRLDNSDGLWRPGQFVSAEITESEKIVAVAVRTESVQILEGKSVIFVHSDEGFEPREVSLGASDGKWIEVTAGLLINELYASKNSFILKSEMGKEDAEHGH